MRLAVNSSLQPTISYFAVLVHLAEATSDGRRAADESVRFAANARSTGCQPWDSEKRIGFCSFSEPTVNVPLTLTNALRIVLMGPTVCRSFLLKVQSLQGIKCSKALQSVE